MKRDCLLSKAYTGPPMVLRGVELAYSALVNEVLRELKTAFFTGDGDGSQTHTLGLVEGLMVMDMVARDSKQELADFINLPRDERNRLAVRFYIENETEVESLKPQILTRMEAAAAAAVESDSPGKSQAQAPDSSG